MAGAADGYSRLAMLCLGMLLFIVPPDGSASSSIMAGDPQSASRQEKAGILPLDAAGPATHVFKGPAAASGDLQATSADVYQCRPAEGVEPKPVIAIIIDDMGQHRRLGQALLELDLNLTFSFLPYAPFTPEQAEDAWRRGRDVLVHMPMEPLDPAWDPGPGTLYLEDSPAQRAERTAASLALVPHAVGVNNHMGSRFTANRAAMVQLLALIGREKFFFIDSITSPLSVALGTARELGIKAAQRHIFLDNIQEEDEIRRQLNLLVARAGQRGRAIAIGHPGRATLAALEDCREMLLSRARIVNVRELVQ